MKIKIKKIKYKRELHKLTNKLKEINEKRKLAIDEQNIYDVLLYRNLESRVNNRIKHLKELYNM